MRFLPATCAAIRATERQMEKIEWGDSSTALESDDGSNIVWFLEAVYGKFLEVVLLGVQKLICEFLDTGKC